jgi:hypothetical protein
MLSTGTFPDRLKFSEIKPIYTKGDKTLITNYRPFPLLPAFSKIFEEIIYKRLYHHLTPYNILVSGSLNFLEPSGDVQACNGIAFSLIY